MLSFLLPKNIQLYCNPGFLKRQGPAGSFVKKTGSLKFNLASTSEGQRLFIQGVSSIQDATTLSYLFRLIQGLSRGYRRRLRLVGIGFRASRRSFGSDSDSQLFPIQTQNYRRKRRFSNRSTGDSRQLLTLKIGFSHESTYPAYTIPGMMTKVSRLEGRSKGTLIALTSNNLAQVNQAASEIRSRRLPNIYKGKGIYYDRETIKLKKGKRQG